jgi:long-chain acyl-CoA synthetase
MRAVDYAQCYRDACALASALQNRGVAPGARIAIHGSTSYEWVLADLACVLTGAISVAMYPSAPQRRVITTAADSRCSVIFTDRTDFIESFIASGLDVISLTADPRSPNVESVSTLLDTPPSRDLPDLVGDTGPFTIVSTSGTLSEPKLFAVHSEPLLVTMNEFSRLYQFSGADRLLLYLPLAHLPQRMMLYWGLENGLDFILSDPTHIVVDSVELQPTLHVAVPRSLEHLLRMMQKRQADGAQTATASESVFGSSLKAVFVGSAPTDRDVLAALNEAGLPIYEVYGATELGMIGLNTPGSTRAGTVGRPIPWGEVSLIPDTDEILVRTPTPFLWGRLVDGDIVEEHYEPGQWLSTADVGSFDDDGYLSVRGRLRDFLALSSGEKVFVRPIEEAATRTTGAELTMLVQRPNSQLGMMLFLPPTTDTVSEIALTRIRVQLTELNGTFHPWERIRWFALIAEIPSMEDGCVTDTMKLRRHKVEDVHGKGAQWHAIRPTAIPA